MSLAVAPASAYVPHHSTVTGLLQSKLIIGFVVSTTFTVLVTCVAGFPFASVILYVTVYDDTAVAFTESTVTIPAVIFPS